MFHWSTRSSPHARYRLVIDQLPASPLQPMVAVERQTRGVVMMLDLRVHGPALGAIARDSGPGASCIQGPVLAALVTVPAVSEKAQFCA